MSILNNQTERDFKLLVCRSRCRVHVSALPIWHQLVLIAWIKGL